MNVKIILALIAASGFVACSGPVPPKCTQETIQKCTKEEQIAAIKRDPALLLAIKHPNVEMKLEALKRDPTLIRFIKNPNKEMQIEVLRQDPSLIRYIEHPHRDAMRY